MSKLTGNEPINPSYDKDGVRHQGLTIRQYYAGLAMQGLLSNDTVRSILSGNNGMPVAKLIAEVSAKYSDAIINALNENL